MMPKRQFSQQITFLHTRNLVAAKQFYQDVLGLFLARDQGTCVIFQAAENAYLGFCEHIEPLEPGRKIILTLVSNDVDGWYEHLKKVDVDILQPPKYSPQFKIYHFFLRDPDGYWIEIQRFDHPL